MVELSFFFSLKFLLRLGELGFAWGLLEMVSRMLNLYKMSFDSDIYFAPIPQGDCTIQTVACQCCRCGNRKHPIEFCVALQGSYSLAINDNPIYDSPAQILKPVPSESRRSKHNGNVMKPDQYKK